MENQNKIIAISGGSGSGKSTLAKRLAMALGEGKCQILPQDHYYKDQSAIFDHDGGSVNFDHPNAIDFELLSKHLSQMKQGETIDRPSYDFATHKRHFESTAVASKPIVIIEGILVLSNQSCRSFYDYTVFVDAPEKTRFERRLARDTIERGRSEEGVHQQFFTQVKPMHDQFVEPEKDKVDLVVSGLNPYDDVILEIINCNL